MRGSVGPAANFLRWLADGVARVRSGIPHRGGARYPEGPRRPTGSGRVLSALRDDVIHAFRSLSRSRGSTLFVVLILAGGLGTSMVVYSTIRHTLLRPLPYENADRFAVMWQTVGGGGGRMSATQEQAELWGGQEDLIEATFLFAMGNATLVGRGDPAALTTAHVSEGFFRRLGVPLSLGRSFVPAEMLEAGPRSVVLGNRLWVQRFGADPGVLGTSVAIDGEPWTVVGVGPQDAPLPTGFPGTVDLWMPLTPERPISSAVAVLRDGVTLDAFRARIDTLVARSNAEALDPSPFGGTATYASEMFGSRSRLGGALVPLSVAVGMLLLITCLNASALLVNRAERRRHETAVRVALGLGRLRLARQYLLESLALATSAGVLATAAAYAGIAGVHRFRPDDLVMLDRAALDPAVLFFGLSVSLGAGLIFGMLPAFQMVSEAPEEALGHGPGGRSDGRTAHRARWGLVVCEIALSFTLVVTSALLVRTMISFQQMDVGFDADRLVVADINLPDWAYTEPSDREAAWERVVDGLRAVPGVVSIERASGMPTRPGIFFGTLEVEGLPTSDGDRDRPFLGQAIGPSYFETLRQPVLAGRSFTEQEVRSGEAVYVISVSTARALWPEGDAVGRRMRLADAWHTVVGVVADVPANGLSDAESRDRQLYAPLKPSEWGLLMIRTQNDASVAIPMLAERLRDLAPEAPIEVYEAATAMGESVALQRFVARVLSFLALLSSVLAAAGLYGVMAQTVGQRTREIGIRMSLGARTGEVVWAVVRSGASAAVVGISAGVLLALAAGRVVESQLFGVSSDDPLSFLSAGLLLSMTVLLAAWMPARRAASIDPVRAMARD